MTHGDTAGGRSGADTALLAALAGGATVEGAAKTAGVSAATAKRRLRNPAFRAELAAIRAETIARAVGVLSMASVGAADELLRLTNSARSEQVRLAAATRILELGMKLRESLDLEQRVTELEVMLSTDRRPA